MKKRLALALGLLLVIAAVWAAMPRYIELRIPVAPHQGGGEFWHAQQYASLSYADTGGALYVYRQIGRAYPDAQGWKTIPEALAFFDAQLAERGWTLKAPGTETAILPESSLLDRSMMRQYSRPGGLEPSPRVLLGIWPATGGAVEGFHVALTTSNPSLFYRLSKGFD